MSEPIRVFIDGACAPNPGHMGIGVVVEWNGKLPLIISKYIGEGTNNIAEYNALIEGLKTIRNEKIMNVKILSDSNLMVNQMKDIKPWKCNDSNLLPLNIRARKMIEELRTNKFNITIEYIPRELNLADNPAKNGSKNIKGED